MKNKSLKILGVLLTSIFLMAGSAFAQSGYVTADLLNVRTSPSTDSAITEVLNWGEALTITYGPTMGWYEIYRNGGCYYVKADYVSSNAGSYGYEESTSSYSDMSSYSDDSYSYSDTSYTEDTYSYTESSQTSGEYLGHFTLTAYCSCSTCTNGSGVTASGTAPVEGRTVAMYGVPFGTQLLINGNVYTVEDRGTSYGHVDIYFNSHQDALNFGVQSADVYQVW